MPAERVPTDVLADELVGIYTRAVSRLATVVDDGLRRGLDPARSGLATARRGDASLRYRRRQLDQARGILAQLRRDTDARAGVVVSDTYRASLIATQRLEGIEAGFGAVHVRAVEALAKNMTSSLRAAIDSASDNVETVFRRADDIEGALENGRSPAPVPFIGRRLDDPYRRMALESVAQGLVAGETRRAVSDDLKRRLITSGVTDATTGFVDRAGRRWPLDTYVEMVARTTTREATTRATVNRLLEGNDAPTVTISHHEHQADVCTPYDGKTFALNAEAQRRTGLPIIDKLTPFHPRCEHVTAPGRHALDEFERELGLAARQVQAARAGGQEPVVPEPTRALPDALPTTLAGLKERLEASVADNVDLGRSNVQATSTAVRAFEDVLRPYGVRVDELELGQAITTVMGRRQQALGLFSAARPPGGQWRRKLSIGPWANTPGSAKRRSQNEQDTYARRRAENIAAMRQRIANAVGSRTRALHQERLDALEAAVRWTTISDAQDPIYAACVHEAAHALEHVLEIKTAFDSASRSVDRLDRLRVSEYAATNARELFAEAIATRQLGGELPASVEAAIDAVLPPPTA